MSVYDEIYKAQTKQGNLGGVKKERKESGPKVEFFLITGTVADAYDSNGKADPYVKIGVMKDSKVKWFFKSPVKKATLSPSWSYTHHEELDLSTTKELVLEMWDNNLLKDAFIGSCTIDVSELSEKDFLYTTYEVHKKETPEKVSGTVYMSIEKK